MDDTARRNFAYDTEAIRAKDVAHHVHPWTDFADFEKTGSMVVAEAEGATIYDSEGQGYLDGIGGLWCVNLGYGRDEIAQAMADQARRMVYYSSFGHHTSVPAAELAAKVTGLAPAGLNHVLFGTGGSMANDTAIRIVHFYFNRLGKPRKKKIITRHDGYHGSTYLAMSLTGVAFDHQGFDLVGEELIARISAPNCYRRPAGTTEAEFLDLLAGEFEAKVLELGPETVAAFIAEPIMGAGGVVVAPAGYHRRIWELCRKYEILYIADEVVTAFGRLGHFFASEAVFGMQPDILTCAKGFSSAYAPLSGTLISDAFHEVISVPQAPGALFTHGFTYSGHPVCCAAGLKTIEIMEREDICGHVRRVGPYFERRLKSLSDLPLVGDVRGSHFMLCVENVADKETKALLPGEVQIGKRIAAAAQARGVLVRPIAHLNVLSPPLILTEAQIDRMVETLRDSILAVQDDLVREGHWRG
ncbi:Adenosylmethionine-8-amino-7-oxononanoate aminotransferase [Tistlia consotensis]|uniref:Adenosylmethionine-8-amino-7-oxononanoate aminotransferase n=1 Tax=Tistlia consotensis USBA 355 TaxID=560819 RepID=A0A1Y6BTZ1_9PROT|nr:aminotransferase [Tistlia consotensis]SMF20354.1 Adenosylmethionine-8-amino-7-oxononanoate aminotransferase [Tistlia consotensis USBA 355]SNR47970.1 Adenosylmethionine-8-amino-7-oxononanoate aminotransferase [Tistlia consotensis]